MKATEKQFAVEGFKVYHEATWEAMKEGVFETNDLINLVLYGERARYFATVYDLHHPTLLAYDDELSYKKHLFPSWGSLCADLWQECNDLAEIASREPMKGAERYIDADEQIRSIDRIMDILYVALAKARMEGNYQHVCNLACVATQKTKDINLMQEVYDHCDLHEGLDLAAPKAFEFMRVLGLSSTMNSLMKKMFEKG